MEVLGSLLRRHFAGKPVVASRNVGCFLKSLDGVVTVILERVLVNYVHVTVVDSLCFSLVFPMLCLLLRPSKIFLELGF